MQPIFESILLPPGINILLLILVPIVWRFGHRAALLAFYVATLSLWLLSTPMVARLLMSSIEYKTPLQTGQAKQAQAMVVLGSGIYKEAPEYKGIDTISRASLERIRYAKFVYERTQLPIILVGGKQDSEHTPEAVAMNHVLLDDYQIAPNWLETTSISTIENAKNTAYVLEQHSMRSIILVTHAFHMKRAKWSFEQYGIDVIPAPMGYYKTQVDSSFTEFLPSAKALNTSNQALKEVIARLVYTLLYEQ